MLRRVITLLLALLLFVPALAEEVSPYQVATFSGSLPEKLKEPLAGILADESRILSSAAIQSVGGAFDKDCYAALVLADSADGLHLYAAAQPEGLPWQVDDFTRFLRQGRNVSVSIYMNEYTRVPCFCVDHYAPAGLTSDLICFWNNQLWCMEGHIDQQQNITLRNEMGMIDVTDAVGREKFRCADPFFLDYMADLSAFPTSRAEAQALSWLPLYEPFSAGMTLFCEGANLRREPTTKSGSLGQYARNVPMVYTGSEKAGTSWPWYQVRIGDTVGWMSGNYVNAEPNLGYAPIPLGRTADGCPLYARPGDKQPAAQLTPGTTFHILTEYEGMYHICIPREVISWAVDAQGVYGYIPREGILTGASPSALDTLAGQ